MLQAKDLRFGNKVYNQKGEVITVQQLLYNSIIYDTRMKIDAEMVNVSGAYQLSYSSQMVEVIEEADYVEIDPIEITPEILKNCGFRNCVREEWVVTSGKSHLDFEYTDKGLKYRYLATPGGVIRHLHQLQNFFYAITGEELSIAI